MSLIKENVSFLKNHIEEVSKASNRNPEEVVLIGVTKTRTPDEINESLEYGITHIGENKVQEILDKYDCVNCVKWHMIGHLQTNKVKYIIDKVVMIHSVDSIKLAKEIDKRANQHNIVMDVLVQVNVAKEESKFGFEAESLESVFEELVKLKNIKLKGIMAIAPYFENAEAVRPYFKEAKALFEHYKDYPGDNIEFEHLSMGMSNDYQVAIEEGATMIRVGSSIFGERDYTK